MSDVTTELKGLRLHGMASAWTDLLAQGATSTESSRWLIEHLLQAETTDRAMRSVSHQMAEYTLALRYESLPREVIEKAKLCILDQLGVQLRGATLPVVQPFYQLVRSLGGKSESTVVLRGDRTAPAFAAYVTT